jgi:hypothetical protein
MGPTVGPADSISEYFRAGSSGQGSIDSLFTCGESARCQQAELVLHPPWLHRAPKSEAWVPRDLSPLSSAPAVECDDAARRSSREAGSQRCRTMNPDHL